MERIFMIRLVINSDDLITFCERAITFSVVFCVAGVSGPHQSFAV